MKCNVLNKSFSKVCHFQNKVSDLIYNNLIIGVYAVPLLKLHKQTIAFIVSLFKMSAFEILFQVPQHSRRSQGRLHLLSHWMRTSNLRRLKVGPSANHSTNDYCSYCLVCLVHCSCKRVCLTVAKLVVTFKSLVRGLNVYFCWSNCCKQGFW